MAEQAKNYFDKTYIDTSKIDVEYASTLNDEKLAATRQQRVEKGSKIAPKPSISKTEKLSKFAHDLGLDPEVLLKKREPIVEDAEQAKVEGAEETKPEKKLKTKPNVEGLDSKRLYVYNFPFSITKEELRAVFEKYGKLTECIIPTDEGMKSKGYGYVAFEVENDAITAFSELDNQIAFGRILHIKPAFTSRREQFQKEKKEEEPKDKKKDEGSSYKRLKREEFMKNLNDDSSWNSLFLNPNTVMDYVAQEYGLSKLDLLNREVENPAVKIALAETKVLNETKQWLQENGVNLKAFEGTKKNTPRSRTVLIIKNLPRDCTKSKLMELLNRYGFVNRILLPTNKSIAIAQFRNIDHASNAFTKLSGFMFQGLPIYLEYAPEALLPDAPNEEDDNEQDTTQPKQQAPVIPTVEQTEEETAEQVKARTVFIKNLSFSTTEESLKAFLRENGYGANLKFAKIIVKNGKSCGYGFAEFNTVEAAEKVLRNMDLKLLDGHKLELTITRSAHAPTENKRKEKLELVASNKIIVRNVDFAATKKELRELVAAFGEVRAVRMPTKVTGEHRGYAFVEFSNVEEAKSAYDALSHSHFYGRKLVIEYAKE